MNSWVPYYLTTAAAELIMIIVDRKDHFFEFCPYQTDNIFLFQGQDVSTRGYIESWSCHSQDLYTQEPI